MIVVGSGGRTFCELVNVKGEPIPILDSGGRVIGHKSRDTAIAERQALAFAFDFLAPDGIVVGDARGFDRWLKIWCDVRGVDCHVEKADWDANGLAGGPMRNQALIDKYHPDAAVVGPGGRGTNDMRGRLMAANVPIYEINLRPSHSQPAEPPARQPAFAGR